MPRYTPEQKADFLKRGAELKAEGKPGKAIPGLLGLSIGTYNSWLHPKKPKAATNGASEHKVNGEAEPEIKTAKGTPSDAETIKELKREVAQLRKLLLDFMMGRVKLVRSKAE